MPDLSVDKGAYRSTRVRPVCKVCGDLAPHDGLCRRCGAPLCDAHAAGVWQRCPTCEASFVELRADLKRHPLRAMHLLGAYILAIALVVLGVRMFETVRRAPVPHPDLVSALLLLAVVAVASLMPLWVVLHRRLRLRARFLAERPGGHRMRPLPPPKRPPRQPACDGSAVTAFVLSLVFVVPLVPLVGCVLGVVTVATMRHRERLPGWWLACAAIPLGLVLGIVPFLGMVSI